MAAWVKSTITEFYCAYSRQIHHIVKMYDYGYQQKYHGGKILEKLEVYNEKDRGKCLDYVLERFVFTTTEKLYVKLRYDSPS